MKRIQVNFQKTGNFDVKVTPAFRDELVFNFNGRIVGDGSNTVGSTAIATEGSFSIPIQTSANTAIIKIENATEKPMTITSIDYSGFFNELTRAEA